MFSEKIIAAHQAYRKQLKVIIALQYLAIFGFLTLFGLTSANENPGDGDSDSFLFLAIFSLLIGHLLRYIWKYRNQSVLWGAFTEKLPNSSPPPPSPTLNISWTSEDTSALIPIAGKQAILSKVTVHYNQTKNAEALGLNFSLDYIVLAVPLEKHVPHIFIDGRKQNAFNRKNPNLWSLPKRIKRGQKMQSLEGDFYKSFSVYTPKLKQIETLSILTPDTMLALRDKGFEFDYELYGKYLYVISEPRLNSPEEYTAFLQAAQGALAELVPQITKQRFNPDVSTIKVSNSKLLRWAMLYSSVVIVKWIFFVTVSLYYAFLVADFVK